MVARQRLSEPVGKATERRLQRVERAAPIGFSSITRGGLRVQSADGIQVKTVPGGAAGLRVTGRQTVDGTLDGDGKLDWTGQSFLRGPVHITGANGTLTVDAETLLQGIATLLNNLSVQAPGKITVGGMVIDPSNGGSVAFPGGAVVKAASGGGVSMEQGNYKAVITSVGASVGKAGLNVSVTDAVGVQFVGLPTTTGKGLPVGTLWADGTNRVFRALS